MRWATVLIVAVFAAVTLPTLGNPIVFWREADGLMVARSFCAERASILRPRIGERGDSDGVTGMEFPVLNWAAGRLTCAGVDPLLALRGLSFASGVLAIVALARIASRYLPARPAALAAGVMALSPTTAFIARSAQPDLAAVALGLWSLDLLDTALRRPGGDTAWGRYLASAALMAGGGLIKLPVVVYGLPALVMLWERRGLVVAARDLRTWLYPLVALAAPLAWYVHAKELQRESGIFYYNLGSPLSELARSWIDPTFYTRIYVSSLFDLYAFPVASGAALLALFVRPRAAPRWWYALFAAAVVFFFLGGEVAAWHGYYGLVMVPSLALLSGALAASLESRLSPRAAWAVAIAGAAGTLAFSVWRMRSWFGDPSLMPQYAAARASIDAALPPDGRVALVSGGDPKVLWYLGRNGWVFGLESACDWARAHGGGFLALDALRLPAGELADAARALEGCGFRSVYAGSAVQVWRQAAP